MSLKLITEQEPKDTISKAVEVALIKGRIAQIEKEREAYIAQANQQISAFQGAIMALKGLIEPVTAEAVEPPSEAEAGPRAE